MKHPPVEPSRFRISTMTREAVDLAVEWAAREGWNPGLHDADCFYAADPEGFLCAELDGVPVGSISAVRYGNEFGFVGFYIMRPEFRGHHIGYDLGCAAANRLADVNAGLDGVVRQQPRYEKLWGAKIAHRNIRYELASGNMSPSEAHDPGFEIVPAGKVPFDLLASYDLQMFQFPREAFLRCWISRPGTVALAAMNEGAVAGYGVLRQCRKGFKLAPLFADAAEIADALFCKLVQHATGEPVYLDIPQVNAQAIALVQRHGMTPVFETARMYTKADPGLPLNRIFGITSFELG